MLRQFAVAVAALAMAVGFSGGAAALIAAKTTAELNLRDAPSRTGFVLLTIPRGAAVAVQNCEPSNGWCQVTYAGRTGFAAGRFLTTTVAGRSVVVIEEPTLFDQLVVRPAEAAGQAAEAVAGAVAGAVTGTARGVANVFRPAPRTVRFLDTAPTGNATMVGAVAVGAAVPPNVPVTIVPDVSYNYAFINGRKVLVDPNTRRIVYVVP